jgi:hypothetical protein
MITGVTAVLDATGGMEAISQGVNSFLEGSAVLMNALDEVSKLHPFIGGVRARYYLLIAAATLTPSDTHSRRHGL